MIVKTRRGALTSTGTGWVAALAVALALVAGADLPAQSADDGEALYVTFGCHQCHGYEGQGGVAGPRIGPTSYPFVAFAQLVRRPANVMPAYAPNVLDDATLERIYDYVRARPQPADLDDITLLR
jgi:mono/diheme cytochrome c family protein